MKLKSIRLFLILASLFSVSFTEHIELVLHKSKILHDDDLTDYIDNLENSNYMAEFTLGTPGKCYSLQVEMAKKDTCIINEKNFPEKQPALGPSSSTSYKRVDTNVQSDLMTLGKKSFSLELQDYGNVYGGPISNQSSGILGLSLDSDWLNPEQTKDYKFINQLTKNKIISNSVFYFNFKDSKNSETCPNNLISLKDYLDTSATLTIGDYPSKISKKTAKIQQILKSDSPVLHDETSNAILFDMTKCIGCQSCVRACTNAAGQNVLKAISVDPNNKKKKIIQTTSGKPMAETNCISCGQCTVGCPKGALVEVDGTKEVTKVLNELKNNKNNKNKKIIVCQFAPAIRVNMAEALGVAPGTISTGKIVTALKMLGFDYIFDTNYAADMTIVEEATEFLNRLKDPNAVLPMFTSCCPAWVNYVEKVQPELIPHLSSCRSPMGMLSSVIKEIFAKKVGVEKDNIYNVAIMPCTAKKDERLRPQLANETDAVITSRELAKMIKAAKIDFKNLKETELDSIYSEHTGGGAIFCATGGVMEAAVRSAYKFLTGKEMSPIQFMPVRGVKEGIKKGTVEINGKNVNVAVAHGTKNAMELIRKIKNKEEGYADIHFVEVMACPGGCVGGGGSPRPKGKTGIEKRLEATYKIDESKELRTPQDNEQLNDLYEESFDGEYGSHKAHELLHTYFTNRQVDKTWGINFKSITLNHTSISSYYSKGLFKIENNFIKAPNSFLQILQREFLNSNEDKCKLLTSNKYNVVICDKEFDVNKFPTLEFYSDELDHTFTLSGKDLFVYDSNYDHILLLIVIDLDTNNESTWELGLPFLMKHNIYFDMENEVVGIIEEGEKISISAAINHGLTVILLILIGVLAITIKRLPGKQRKKKANELVDDHEYNVML